MSEHSEQSSEQPWKIIEQADDWIMLGIDDEDEERMIVYPRVDSLTYVYRCGTCGWAKTCGDKGEECHT